MHLTLYCCYELHYQGWAGVDDRWEWEPSLLQLRGRLEASFEDSLRAAAGVTGTRASDVAGALWDMSRLDGPSLSQWALDYGTRFHAQELAVHRSAYQLKEADPHTWAIPRLTGTAKAALVKIQADEYGSGTTADMHASLFADAMRSLDLDSTYGAYIDRLPAVTLATTNLISMFGLNRRLRGALVGHLAAFEMNSVEPMSRYGTWMKRLGLPPRARRFYDVHVEADEIHQHIAVDDLVGGFLADEPGQADEVLFGARALGAVEGAFTRHVLDAWTHRRTSLLPVIARSSNTEPQNPDMGRPGHDS